MRDRFSKAVFEHAIIGGLSDYSQCNFSCSSNRLIKHYVCAVFCKNHLQKQRFIYSFFQVSMLLKTYAF